MDKEFWELEYGRVIDNIEFFALQKNLKLVVIVDMAGELETRHYDFLRDIPFARCDN